MRRIGTLPRRSTHARKHEHPDRRPACSVRGAGGSDAYRQMLVDVAQRAAEASKEGGFLGFGGVRVSDKEQAFITEVKKTVGLA